MLVYRRHKVQHQVVLLPKALPQTPLALVRRQVATSQVAAAGAARHGPCQLRVDAAALRRHAGQLLQEEGAQLPQLAALVLVDVEGARDLRNARVCRLVGDVVNLRDGREEGVRGRGSRGADQKTSRAG